MNRFAWLTWLAAMAVVGASGHAEASKLEVSIRADDRYLNGPDFYRFIDLVDGKLPEITAERSWVAHGYGSGRSLSAPMTFHVAVTEWVTSEADGGIYGYTVARGTLTGQAQGWAGYYYATGHGSATFKDLVIENPSKAPDWLPNLQVDVAITPTDLSGGSYVTTLTVSAVPVPEPGSAMSFLGAAVAALVIHRRNRGRADAA